MLSKACYDQNMDAYEPFLEAIRECPNEEMEAAFDSLTDLIKEEQNKLELMLVPIEIKRQKRRISTLKECRDMVICELTSRGGEPS